MTSRAIQQIKRGLKKIASKDLPICESKSACESMADNKDPSQEEPNNNGPSDDSQLPDPDQVATEWSDLDDDIAEEPVVDAVHPFANQYLRNSINKKS